MAKKLALNSKIGLLGEDIAVKFLMKHGFRIDYRNYLKKWGEIDVVAQKDGITHFIEVKSVSCENIMHLTYNAADNLTNHKLKRLSRVIESYKSEFHVEQEWQMDAILVYMDFNCKEAKVEHLENISL